jgi:hypothetical protein
MNGTAVVVGAGGVRGTIRAAVATELAWNPPPPSRP